MKIAYVTIKNARDLGAKTEWSGTGYYIGQALKKQSIEIEYFGPLQNNFLLRFFQSFKRKYYQNFWGKNYLKDTEPVTLKYYVNQVARKLAQTKVDIVFSATVNPIAYLECHQPIIFWADATFANTADFYPRYSNLCQETIKHGHYMESLALKKCKFAIYSSKWAADTAIDRYGVDPSKVKIVNFGANLDINHTLEKTKAIIASKPSSKCKLLFLGRDWLRKGGDIALEVAEKLNTLGLDTELTIMGCEPPKDKSLPDFVKSVGFISKLTTEGRAQIAKIIAESHFLVLPTIADCSPIVLCEANSLGVPCISTKVGGIPSIIKDGLNGKLFALETDIKEYCDYILNLFLNYADYQSLALSSFNEYRENLNWSSVGYELKQIFNEAIDY